MRMTFVTGVTALLLASSAQAATLNKCIDAMGQVTYSNLPCRNAHKTQAVEIDPAPAPDPVKPAAPKLAPVKVAPVKTPPESDSAPQLSTNSNGKPAKPASARQCDSLSDKLGSIFDKMDEARRKGYTQEQMNKWNQEIQSLEAKKQQSGCF
ncbi:MAG: DUF4124 domain-containing protein [Thiobacillus sp.]|nr:DUF4124 domain-containing protein [Thiobacillus sp.]